MLIKAAQEEQDMYGDSVYFMVIQLSSTMGPYVTALIGGGTILAIAAFLTEYQKRSEMTAQLIQVLSEQRIAEPIKQQPPESHPASEDHQVTNNATDTSSKKEIPFHSEDERFYWNG